MSGGSNKANNEAVISRGYLSTLTVGCVCLHSKDLHYDACKTVRIVDTHRYKVYSLTFFCLVLTLNVCLRTFRHML